MLLDESEEYPWSTIEYHGIFNYFTYEEITRGITSLSNYKIFIRDFRETSKSYQFVVQYSGPNTKEASEPEFPYKDVIKLRKTMLAMTYEFVSPQNAVEEMRVWIKHADSRYVDAFIKKHKPDYLPNVNTNWRKYLL